MPLTPGAIQLADARGFTGIAFTARGAGDYVMLFDNYGIDGDERFKADFSAGESAHEIRIPFSAFKASKGTAPLDLATLRALIVRLQGEPGGNAWLHKENHAMAKLKRALSITGAAVVIIGASGNAYQPRETFAPFDMQQAVNAYRSPNGLPGPAYWQNRADYVIRAKLDTATKTISGTTIITYRNNSPDALDALWLQLDQNMYRPGARGAMSRGGLSRGTTDGMTLDRVTVAVAAKPGPITPTSSDTRARLPLPAELPAHATAVVTIHYHYTVPGEFGGRTAWGRSRDGEIYDLAQWYPRMAVYDDIRGWDTAPYLGQEFYLEYGDFDYAVTVPSDMIVAGSGELVNPAEVLTPTQVARLARARTSAATVALRAPSEIADPASRPHGPAMLTWHFRMHDTRDVAWSASSVFAWDAARINLPGGRASLALSFYPAESQGADKWGRSTEYMKDAVERFLRRWFLFFWFAVFFFVGFAFGLV